MEGGRARRLERCIVRAEVTPVMECDYKMYIGGNSDVVESQG